MIKRRAVGSERLQIERGIRRMANLCLHNRDNGFTESLCRGFRTGFLSDADYHHLTQCETLDDMRMNLAETDYADFLANESSVT